MTIDKEKVTVEIPKAIMDLLRFSEPMTNVTPKQFIEKSTIEAVRTQLESNTFLPEPKELAKRFNLDAVFAE